MNKLYRKRIFSFYCGKALSGLLFRKMVVNDKESASLDDDYEAVIQIFLEKFEKAAAEDFKKLNFEFLVCFLFSFIKM